MLYKSATHNEMNTLVFVVARSLSKHVQAGNNLDSLNNIRPLHRYPRSIIHSSDREGEERIEREFLPSGGQWDPESSADWSLLWGGGGGGRGGR